MRIMSRSQALTCFASSRFFSRLYFARQSSGKLLPRPASEELGTGISWQCQIETIVRATRSLESVIVCWLPPLATVMQSGETVVVPCGDGTVIRMPIKVLQRYPRHCSGWITSDARGANGPRKPPQLLPKCASLLLARNRTLENARLTHDWTNARPPYTHSGDSKKEGRLGATWPHDARSEFVPFVTE